MDKQVCAFELIKKLESSSIKPEYFRANLEKCYFEFFEDGEWKPLHTYDLERLTNNKS